MERDAAMPPPRRLLTFRTGGWVILVAVLMTLGLALWALLPAISRGPVAARTIEDYGFNLSNLRVPRAELVTALPKDSLPKWDSPPLVPTDAISEQIRFGRKKYLVSTDRVVGVIVNGQSRTYPISLLTVHEVINDTLAGVPIAVTYHPWCDSVVVFERTLNGESIELAPSGLILDSNLVLFDRRPDAANESLFRQLSGEAIAGPAVELGESLNILPATLTTWGDWRTTHPETSVIGWDELLVKRYEGSSPDQYFRSPELAFPVDPLPPAGALKLKDRVIVVIADGERRVYPLPLLEQKIGEDNIFRDEFGSTALVIRYDPLHQFAVLEAPAPIVGSEVQVIYAMWFAWFAVHGDADVVGIEDGESEGTAARNG
jgi:hypothetical protein